MTHKCRTNSFKITSTIDATTNKSITIIRYSKSPLHNFNEIFSLAEINVRNICICINLCAKWLSTNECGRPRENERGGRKRECLLYKDEFKNRDTLSLLVRGERERESDIAWS